MNVTDGRAITQPHEQAFDVVIVGSGPAGAAVARQLARAGAKVAVVEEGPYVEPAACPESGFQAMAKLYRDLGGVLAMGNAPMPVLQGRAVGGSSVINGAISWRMPRDVHAEWVAKDPPLADALPWETIEATLDDIERDLNIAPTPPDIAGRRNLLMGEGADTLGLEHRPISRNVRGCRGLSRCLQGCPEGHKLSMDQSYLPDAVEHGAVIFSSTTARRVEVEDGTAQGIEAISAAGAKVRLTATRAVVLAASAVQTPALLIKSGLGHGPVGRHFQCHPGVSMAGRFREPAPVWIGATQGHEVIGLRHEGLKFEVLGYDVSILGTRLKTVGRELARDFGDAARWVNWGAAIRAQGEGIVKAGRRGASVRFSLTPDDLSKVRRGVRVLGELMLAAGAELVTPGVYGWHEKVTDRSVMARFEEEGPLDGKAYTMAMTHLFGTCRMSSQPGQGVVRPDFRHHTVDRLYVADSSVFPSNLGVNPQSTILALATMCARRIAA